MSFRHDGRDSEVRSGDVSQLALGLMSSPLIPYLVVSAKVLVDKAIGYSQLESSAITQKRSDNIQKKVVENGD